MKSQNDDTGVATFNEMSLEAREKLVMEKADSTTKRLEETCLNLRKQAGKSSCSNSNNTGVLSDIFEAIKWW